MKKIVGENTIKSFFTKEINSISKHIVLFYQVNNLELLHTLRISIKKLRACCGFAHQIYGKSFQTSKLKALFNLAGQLRQFQINYQLLNKIDEPAIKLLNQLNHQEKKLTKEFISKCQIFALDIKTFASENTMPNEPPDIKAIKKFFKKKQKKANSVLKKHKKARLHRYRKSIKKLIYIFEILPHETQCKIDFNKKSLDKLQIKIGRWHDTFAAIHFIKQFNDQKRFSNYLSALKKKEKSQFEKIIHQLKCSIQ